MTPGDAVGFQVQASSMDEARERIGGLHGPVAIEPLRRALHIRCEGYLSDTVSVSAFTTSTGLLLGNETGFDGFTLGLAPQGGCELSIWGQPAQRQTQAQAMLVDSTLTKSTRFQPGTRVLLTFVSTQQLQQAFFEASGRPWACRPAFDLSLPADHATARMSRHIMEALLAGFSGEAPLANAPLAVQNLENSLLSLLLRGWSHNGSAMLERAQRVLPQPRHVYRAIEYMRAHAGEPIRLSDIAQAAATSPRTLQDGFRRFRSTTPMEYLRELRLTAVHADLLDPLQPSSVGAIARRWGFTHPGDFAVRYRRAFGETASETLHRRSLFL